MITRAQINSWILVFAIADSLQSQTMPTMPPRRDFCYGTTGCELVEHATWSKNTNFEIDAGIPLIVRFLGRDSSKRFSDATVEPEDLYLSFCKFAAVKSSERGEGKSLIAISRQQNDLVWREHVLSQY